MRRVVLAADQFLHKGDVVSRSGGFEMTATRTPVSDVMSIHVMDESVKAGSGPSLL